MAPLLWVKSYPNQKEVAALADLGAQNVGMELFLGGNQVQNEDCLKAAQDHYPRVGIELFCYQDEEKGKGEIIYDPASPDAWVRELSRDYLFRAMELGVKCGATHLQLDGNDGYHTRPGQIIGEEDIARAIDAKNELLRELRDRFGCSLPVYFENTFPIDDHAPELVFSLTGHRLSDFWKRGLPLEYDVAHHAVALDVYNRASEFGFPFNVEENILAERVGGVGITQAVLEDLMLIPEIYFTQLGNASRFALRKKADVIPAEPAEALLDLEKILPVLMEKSKNITPEVQDTDYVARPNLRAWIKRLQDFKA